MSPPETLLRRNSTKRKPRTGEPVTPVELPAPLLPAADGATHTPSETLIARAQGLKHSVKALTAFFDTLAKLETLQQKEIEKAAQGMEASTKEWSSQRNANSGETSLEHLMLDIQARSKLIGAQHEAAQRSIESECIQPLKQIRLDIKAHIKGIETSVATKETRMREWHQASINALTELKHSLAHYHAGAFSELTSKTEPYVANCNAQAVLERQLMEENVLVLTTLTWQKRSKDFEEGILKQLSAVWKALDRWKSQGSTEMQQEWKALADGASGLKCNGWISLETEGKLLKQDQPLRDVHDLTWPGADDEAVKPLKRGQLQRKRRYTALYKKRYFVLTPFGYLHEYDIDSTDVQPRLSLWLKACILGPRPDVNAKKHTFWVGGRRAMSGTFERSMKRSLKLGNGELQYVWRFSTYTEMEEWWTACSKFCKASYTAQEQFGGQEVPVLESQADITEEESGYESSVAEEEGANRPHTGKTTEAPKSVRYSEPLQSIDDDKAKVRSIEAVDKHNHDVEQKDTPVEATKVRVDFLSTLLCTQCH